MKRFGPQGRDSHSVPEARPGTGAKIIEFPLERISPASSLSPSRGGTGVPWWYDAQAMMRLYRAAFDDALLPRREEDAP